MPSCDDIALGVSNPITHGKLSDWLVSQRYWTYEEGLLPAVIIHNVGLFVYVYFPCYLAGL